MRPYRATTFPNHRLIRDYNVARSDARLNAILSDHHAKPGIPLKPSPRASLEKARRAGARQRGVARLVARMRLLPSPAAPTPKVTRRNAKRDAAQARTAP